MPAKRSTRNKSAGRGAAGECHVALLRGINVGGNNMLPMRDLQAMFIKAGCADARTYIQSGNVIFRATSAVARSMEKSIPEMVERQFGFRPAAIVRSAADVKKIIDGNPFAKTSAGRPRELTDADWKMLHVGFLADAPAADRVAALDVRRSPGDEFAVRGDCIYLRYANGAGKTRLTGAYLESTLKTQCTARNWRTTLTLLEMMQAPTESA